MTSNIKILARFSINITINNLCKFGSQKLFRDERPRRLKKEVNCLLVFGYTIKIIYSSNGLRNCKQKII